MPRIVCAHLNELRYSMSPFLCAISAVVDNCRIVISENERLRQNTNMVRFLLKVAYAGLRVNGARVAAHHSMYLYIGE